MLRRFKSSLALLLCLLLVWSTWCAAEGFSTDAWEPVERGSWGDEVRSVQEQLRLLGYLDGEADGIFGPETELALLTFQLTAEIRATGIANAETMEALLSPDAPEYDPAFKIDPGIMAWIPRTGHRYHKNRKCSGMKEPTYVTIDEAIEQGFTPCKRCFK